MKEKVIKTYYYNPITSHGFKEFTGIVITDKVKGNIKIKINPVEYGVVGEDANKSICYFSRDGGITAVPADKIAVGDRLYWNADVAQFNLDEGDTIELKDIIFVKP